MAIKLNRDLDKFYGRGGHMSDHRRQEKSIVARVASRWLKMSRGIYIALKDLPPVLQRALQSVRYNRKDIEVEKGTTFSLKDGTALSSGQRGYVIVANLLTGQFEMTEGSWGGGNPFESRAVDVDDRRRPIPPNGAVILGSYGGRGSFARIRVNPETLAGILPQSSEELPEQESLALRIIRGIRGGARSEYFRHERLGEYNAQNPIIQSLAKKGFVKIDARGSIQITTNGKNAISTAPSYY